MPTIQNEQPPFPFQIQKTIFLLFASAWSIPPPITMRKFIKSRNGMRSPPYSQAISNMIMLANAKKFAV